MDPVVTLEEAVERVTQIAAECAVPYDARCMEVLIRVARRMRKTSSTSLAAAGSAAKGAQHFVAARQQLDAGLEEIGHVTRAIASTAVAEPVDSEEEDKKK
jgi:hypothetical protein